jgi:DNA helicase HerA-like ATPase
MELSQKTIAQLAELNRARADYRLVQRMERLESVEGFFYDKLTQLTKRIEELERALSDSKLVRSNTRPNRLRAVPATTPALWKSDDS